ncbi:MAG: FeoB-associated Cys-rich membrane protein [Paludibacteraceae bacterium]
MQNVIVTIVVVLAVGYVLYQVYKMATKKYSDTPQCGSCAGCDDNMIINKGKDEVDMKRLKTD